MECRRTLVDLNIRKKKIAQCQCSQLILYKYYFVLSVCKKMPRYLYLHGRHVDFLFLSNITQGARHSVNKNTHYKPVILTTVSICNSISNQIVMFDYKKLQAIRFLAIVLWFWERVLERRQPVPCRDKLEMHWNKQVHLCLYHVFQWTSAVNFAKKQQD